MSQFTRRVAAVGVAALALGLGAMGSITATAAPTTPGTPPSYAPSWLALTTGTSNTVKLQTVEGTKATQTLRAGKGCSYSSSGATLLTLESHPDSPGVGLAGGAFGVRESFTSSGTSCSAVDSVNGEVLSLNLGDVGGLVAASASLDINLKQSAQILATAKLGGTAVGWFELRSGTTITAPKPLDLPEGAVLTDSFTCNNPADSGPDSGTNNNCRWEVSAPSWTSIGEDGVVFDRLELKAVNGSFSLMGGADGYADDPTDFLPGYFGASGPSVFELVEGVIDCGETVTLSGTAVTSSWKRLDNFGETSAECDPFPYSSRTGVDGDGRLFAEFTKPLDFETNAQALWTATFFVGAGNTVPPIRIELDQFGTTEKLVFDPVPMCPAGYFDDSGTFAGPESEPLDPLACLVSAVRGTGKLGKYATYTAYVYGDATMRR